MLKYLALLFFVGLVVAEDDFKWDAIPVVANSSQCVYRPELRVLSCRGPNGIVECPTEFESSRLGSLKFPVFGIRRDEVVSVRTPVEESLFELYPRKIDNTTYLNTTVIVEDKPVEVFLYFHEKPVHAGFRITDAKCFRRIVETVFTPSTGNHVVKLESGEEVGLFGEILFADKPTNKRWLGLGFPWLGLGMGMWGWGLGWGLPFWG
jgi:hypothetical protein